MSYLNRTFFLWLAAIIVALMIVNPRKALFQRINTMNSAAVDCMRQWNCNDARLITEAREYYQILDELYPAYGRGSEMEGMCYLLLKQDHMAVKKFRQAVRHNPDLFWVSFELGKALYRERKFSQALKYFQSINAQDNNALFKEAALSSLRRLPDQTRGALMLELIDFVREIKFRSFQLSIGCLLHQGDLAQAKTMISQGSSNSQFGKDEFFLLADSSMEQEASRKAMLSWVDSLSTGRPIFHPWIQFIPPLKELWYQ